jgi:hypothetical protein
MTAILLIPSCSDSPAVTTKNVYSRPPKNLIPKHLISWIAPENFKKSSPHPLQEACYLFEGLELSLAFLNETGGGTLANVNRWREQLQLLPWTNKDLEKNLSLVTCSLGSGNFLQLSNPTTQQSFLIYQIQYQQGTWFIKMKGPQSLIQTHKGDFLAFIETLQPFE